MISPRWLSLLALTACAGDPAMLPPNQLDETSQPGAGAAGQQGKAGAAGTSVAAGNGPTAGAAGGSAAAGAAGGSGAAGSAGGGAAGAGGGAGSAGGCKEDGDCLPQGLCLVCSPGSHACPGSRCLEGLCQETPASCAGAPDCSPVIVEAMGGCDLPLGWRWDGKDCVLLSGCSCGEGCGGLLPSRQQCLDQRAGCVPAGLPCEGKPCGAPCSPCPPWEACEEAPYRCDGQGLCAISPGPCPACLLAADCVIPPPKSCPGAAPIPYEASCNDGVCSLSVAECPDVNVCQDNGAWVIPGCPIEFLGFAWLDGACIETIGCGVDFPELISASWDECNKLHKKCKPKACKVIEDCPTVTECSSCPDGSASCPTPHCADNECVYHPGSCP